MAVVTHASPIVFHTHIPAGQGTVTMMWTAHHAKVKAILAPVAAGLEFARFQSGLSWYDSGRGVAGCLRVYAGQGNLRQAENAANYKNGVDQYP